MLASSELLPCGFFARVSNTRACSITPLSAAPLYFPERGNRVRDVRLRTIARRCKRDPSDTVVEFPMKFPLFTIVNSAQLPAPTEAPNPSAPDDPRAQLRRAFLIEMHKHKLPGDQVPPVDGAEDRS